MGLLRLFLALSVIAGHAQTTIFGFNGIGATYAVNFFFIISGFYMSMVLNGKYRTTAPTIFYKSRALRLFPAYYIGLALSVLVSHQLVFDFFGQLSWQSRIFYVFQNLFIIGHDLPYIFCYPSISGTCASPYAMVINPPSWSLSVELAFYLIAPFIIKSTTKTFIFVLVGCAYLLSINSLNFPLESIHFIRVSDIYSFSYYFYPSSFIFFGGGALAYHMSKSTAIPRYGAAVSTILLLAFSQTVMPFWHLLFFSMAIPVLFRYTASNSLDRQIGELSYPLYILHFPILLFLKPIAQNHPEYFNFLSIGTVTAIVAAGLGFLIYVFVEKPINSYRKSTSFLKDESPPIARIESRISLSMVGAYLLFPLVVVTYIYAEQYGWVGPSSAVALDITDGNWEHGISRSASAFVVSNSANNRELLNVGTRVKFLNDEQRKILLVEKAGPYLNIYVDGDPLSGGKAGFPHKIVIVEKEK